MNDTNQTHDVNDPNWEDDMTQAHRAGVDPRSTPAAPSSDGRGGATAAAPIRPTGISWVTVVLGVACLVLAGIVLTLQLSDLRIAWTVAAPAIVVGAGVLLLLVGAVGIVRGRNNEDLQLD